MRLFSNILVSVDSRADDHPALETASQLAVRQDATMTLMAVIREFSWHVRLALDDPDGVKASMVAEAKAQLERLAGPLRDQGLTVETVVRVGKTSLEIIREARQQGHDLVVRINKAATSRREGLLGNTSFNLLRKCPCPVWIVRPGAPTHPRRLAAAIDPTVDDEDHRWLNQRLIEWGQALATCEEGTFEIVNAWNLFGEDQFKFRMTEEEFEDFKTKAHQQVERAVDDILTPHGLSTRDRNVHLIKGDAHRAIPAFVEANGIDLILMGSVARTGLVGLVIGNTAELILDRVPCSILAIKPQSFVCPVPV